MEVSVIQVMRAKNQTKTDRQTNEHQVTCCMRSVLVDCGGADLGTELLSGI